MTVWIYVNTSKQVGDTDHLKVFANDDAAETWLQENDPGALRSSMSLGHAAAIASRQISGDEYR